MANDTKNTNKHIDIFELKTSADLFRKAETDLAQLELSNQNPHIAFNFFVTVEHLPDWLNMRSLVKKNCLLRIVSHLANGVKHFEIDEARHSSIISAEKSKYAEDGYAGDDYFEEPILVKLSPQEAKELGMSEIDAVTLGKKVVEFWRTHMPIT